MRYYLMEEDKLYTRVPRMKDLHKYIDVRDIEQGNYYKIPKRFLLRLEEEKDINFIDIIVNPIFIVVASIKNLFQMFEPNLSFKEVILLEQVYSKMETYYFPTLELIDCLSSQSIYNLDHSELKKIVLREDLIKDKSIFAIKGIRKRYIIARLDVVEAMLRRDAMGFRLTEVELE